jgi:predicted ribosome quality control (RQC) complex YloA/Tae2 family protein
MGYSPRIMDALVLALWAQENASVLEGLTIHDATVIRDWRIGLDLGREWLTVSLEPSFLAVFSETRPPGRPAGGLPATLTNAMVGARITGLDTIAGERILRLVTDRGTLVIELLPASPALVWVSEEGQVVTSHRRGRPRGQRLQSGSPYEPPQPPPGVPFPGLDRRVERSLGLSESRDWASMVAAAATAAGSGVHVVAAGERLVIVPGPVGEEPDRPVSILATEPDVNGAARIALVRALKAGREAAEARVFRDRLRTLSKRIDRALEAVGVDQEKARNWPQLEKYGSALLAQPHRVARGQSSVTVPDIFDPAGPPLEIPIDPRLTATENAAGYLRRAKRGKRGLERIAARRVRLESDRDWLGERGDREADGWPDAEREHLDELLDHYRVRCKARPSARTSGRATPARPEGRFHPRRYRSTDGWLMLVGRSNEENDWLSLKYAKPDDIWLHAQGVAGSHVVIRRDARKENPSRATLEEAAALAAAFSKAQHAGSVPVIYTLAKYVRKPRKARAGLVTCTREKTLIVAPANLKDAKYADERIED